MLPVVNLSRNVLVPNGPEKGGSTKLEVNELQQMSEKVSGTGLNSGNNSPLLESHKPPPHILHRSEECEKMKNSTCTLHQASQSLQMKTTMDPKGGKCTEGEDTPNGSSNSIPGHLKVSPTSSGYLSDADPKTLDNSSQGSSCEEEWEDAHRNPTDQNLPAGNDQIQTGRVVTEAETKPQSKAKVPREQVPIDLHLLHKTKEITKDMPIEDLSPEIRDLLAAELDPPKVMCENWKHFGHKTGISQKNLDYLEYSGHGNGQECKTKAILNIHGTMNKTVDVIFDALEKMKRYSTLERFCQQLCAENEDHQMD